MMQAFVDGSGTGDPNALVLAGYIAHAEVWAEFSNAWQARLREAGLQRFKMNEMAPSRMEMAAYFYRLIEEHEIPLAISCIIHTRDLVKVCREFQWPDIPNIRKIENPYFLGFRAIMEFVVRNQQKIGITEPIDFIFDNQGEVLDAMAAWELVRLFANPEARALLGDHPVPKDDEKVLPLQAADLYAWWVFKWFRAGDANAGVRDLAFAWSTKRKINRFHIEYREDDLRKGLAGILERAERLAKLEQTPRVTVSVDFTSDLADSDERRRRQRDGEG